MRTKHCSVRLLGSATNDLLRNPSPQVVVRKDDIVSPIHRSGFIIGVPAKLRPIAMAPSPFLQKMRDVLRRKHYALRTEETYIYWTKDSAICRI